MSASKGPCTSTRSNVSWKSFSESSSHSPWTSLRRLRRQIPCSRCRYSSVFDIHFVHDRIQALREKLAEYRTQIDNGVKEVNDLCVDGAGVLTPDEFHSLKENGHKLLQTFQSVMTQTNEAVEKLNIATPLLIEFSTKSGELYSWLFDKSKELDEADLRPGEAAKFYQKV